MLCASLQPSHPLVSVKLDVVSQALAGRYEVERTLARGGMSFVFEGRQTGTGRRVAIKVLRPEFAATLVGDRFHREVAILAALEHPNVLPLIESGLAGRLVYYVMPFAAGDSLRPRLAREHRLSLDDALAIARDVAAALDYAHGRNIIHRDIKPENIMFLEPGDRRAVICDFGVARAIMAAGGERISSSGLVVGTPSYMSPEQAAGMADLDHRSDIYALACVVYEMLAGEPPFTGRSAQSIMARQVRERPPSLRIVRPDTPQHVEDALLQALAKAPEDRPGSGSDLVQLLSS